MTDPRHQKRYLFPVFFGLFLAANITAVASGLSWLYRILNEYEASRPENRMKEIAAVFEERDAGRLLEWSGYQLSEFEGETQFAEAVAERFPEGAEIGFARRAGSPEGTYEITAAGSPAATVVLKKKPGESEKISGWELETVEIPLKPIPEITVDAPSGLTVAVNGKEVPETFASGKTEAVSAYDGLPEGLPPPASGTRYVIPGLLREPDVTAEGAEVVRAEDGRYIATRLPEESEKEEWSAHASEASKLYARFITTDATFTDLAPYLLKGTQTYKNLASFDNHWYIEHDSFEFGEVTVDGFSVYDESHFSCEVSFLYLVHQGKKLHEFPSSYTLYYVRTDEGWKIANMLVR